jgi:phage recombination protein Bet
MTAEHELPEEPAVTGDLGPSTTAHPVEEVEHEAHVVELRPDAHEVAHPALMVNASHLDLIRTVLNPDLTDGELALFAQVANRVGLDPFARQIYATKRGGKMVIQTGIDGYRLIARRTGKMRGRLGPYFCGPDGEWRIGPNAMPLPWLGSEAPTAALVGVRVDGDDVPTWGIASWAEYAITGTGDAMWRKMPSTMIAKCAEAQAIRAAFPAETSGVYTEEEMAQAGDEDRPRTGAAARTATTGGRLDPWKAKPRDVVAELRRRNLSPAGREPELRQRLAEAMLADGSFVDVAASADSEAQDGADDPATAEHPPEATSGHEDAQEAPLDEPAVEVRYCALPECGADLDETGSVVTPDGDYCPDHAPL